MTLLYISILSPLIPIGVGWKNRLTLLWIYALTGLVFDAAIFFFKRIMHVNHQWPANLFILLEFLLVSLLYRKVIFKDDRIFSLVVSILAICFVVDTSVRSVYQFNMMGVSALAFVYIVYCIVGFYQLLEKQEVLFLEKSWFFWLNVAFTLYASGAFLLFLFRDYLINSDLKLFSHLWYKGFQILNITKNLLIAVALYHYKPAPRESY